MKPVPVGWPLVKSFTKETMLRGKSHERLSKLTEVKADDAGFKLSRDSSYLCLATIESMEVELVIRLRFLTLARIVNPKCTAQEENRFLSRGIHCSCGV
jgi:hypothetical protein